MQPVYQIPGPMLAAHAERLRSCEFVLKCPPRLYALLFLSGFRLAYGYWVAARKGDEFFTNCSPAHQLDDGLESMAKRCLRFLLERARSRDMREMLRDICDPSSLDWKWMTVKFGFIGLFDQSPRTVRAWLAKGDPETARVRLSCGMGIRALWDSAARGFILPMVREPLGLDREEHAAIQAFILTPENALPEL